MVAGAVANIPNMGLELLDDDFGAAILLCRKETVIASTPFLCFSRSRLTGESTLIGYEEDAFNSSEYLYELKFNST